MNCRLAKALMFTLFFFTFTELGSGNFGLLGKVTRSGGRPFGFSAGTPANPAALVGKTIKINGTNYEIVAAPSTNMLYTLTNPGAQNGVPYTHIPASPAGVLGKKQ